MKKLLLPLALIPLFISCDIEEHETAAAYNQHSMPTMSNGPGHSNDVSSFFYGTYGCKANYKNYGTVTITKENLIINTQQYKVNVPLTEENVYTINCNNWITLTNGQIIKFSTRGHLIGDTWNYHFIIIYLLDSDKNIIREIGEYQLDFSEPQTPLQNQNS